MMKKILRRIDRTILNVKKNQVLFSRSEQLQNLHKLILKLHCNINEHLNVLNLTPKIQIDFGQRTQIKQCKSLKTYTDDSINNEEQIIECDVSKSIPRNTKQYSNQKEKEKSASSQQKHLSLDKNFQQLIENITLIIDYQNKVEKLLQSINNKEIMTEICFNQNLIQNTKLNMDKKTESQNSLQISSLQVSIKKIIEDCKQFKQVHNNSMSPQLYNSVQSYKTESDNNQKKSLLTQLLRNSQVLQIQNKPQQVLKRNQRKSEDNRNHNLNSKKILLKQIDFSGYRIQNINTRRQKKESRQNCGQCSPCVIF